MYQDISYKEYRLKWRSPRYTNSKWKCIYFGCFRRGYYECGDMRYWYPCCEKHAQIKEKFEKGEKPPSLSDWYKPPTYKPYWEF